MAQAGIMSMFSNMFNGGNNGAATPTAPQNGQVTTPANPGNIPNNAPNTGATSDGTAPNGTVPAIGTDGKPTTTATPFDDFKELWQPNATDPNAPEPQKGVFGNVDPKRFMEAAGKIDFSKVVTPEQKQQIAAGGEPAIQAFAEAMNKVAQGVYAQSAFASTKMIEAALAKGREQFLAELPQHIKRQTVTDSLSQENPVFSNPAVKPIISALEAQLTVKYPNATAPEITALAKQYIEALGTSVAPKQKQENNTPGTRRGAKQETEWDKFLDEA